MLLRFCLHKGLSAGFETKDALPVSFYRARLQGGTDLQTAWLIIVPRILRGSNSN
jgi:hypothetical protein